MSTKRLDLRRFVQVVVLFPILAAGPALGQTTFWIADEGDWIVGSNWSDGRPAPGIDAQINNGGTARIINPAIANDVILGFSPANSGTLEVEGQAEFDGGLTVGREGTGALNIVGGGAVSNGSSSIGRESGSSGTVTVNGADSTWNLNGLSVGLGGEGTLMISDGGEVDGTSGVIGRFADSTGTVTVSGVGSRWDTRETSLEGPLTVGREGVGTLTIEDGGSVRSVDSIIGDFSDSIGMVTVSGSSWRPRDLTVGDEGEGTLMISNDSTVVSDDVFIGRNSGSTGAVTVTGDGSLWTNIIRLSIGGDADAGNGGTGTLMIGPGGEVSTSEEIVLFPDGLVQLQGGLLSTREFDFQGGQFEWTSGILLLDLWDGDLTTPPGGTFIPGLLGGSDTISGTVLGNYTQESDATLLFGIAGLTPGTEFSVLAVEGTATLDGTLDVLLDEFTFTPEIGDEFTVLTAESVVDNGLELGSLVGAEAIPSGPAASLFELVVDSTSVTLRTIATVLAGDFNGDGLVDAADYTVWRDGLGSTFNQDDYDVWKNNFGATAENGAGNAAAVSEPGAGILISVALCGVIAMRRRWRAGSAGAPSSRVAAPVAYAPGLPRAHCGGTPMSSTWRWPM